MKASAKLMAKEIENGNYFLEARKWYNDIFLYPARDAALMLLSSLFFVVMAGIVVYNITSIFPLSRSVTVVVPMENTVDFYPTLHRVAEKGKSTRDAVAESLGAKYVKARESYNVGRYRANYLFLMNSSGKDIFDQYYNHINPSINKESPLVLYKGGGESVVNIISSEFDTKTNLINVKFSKKSYNKLGSLISSSFLEADIDFYLSDYDFKKSTSGKIEFIVTKYDVKDLKN